MSVHDDPATAAQPPTRAPHPAPEPGSSDHVARNRVAWDGYAAQYAGPGRRAWATDEATWGVFGVPEAELQLLPDVSGLDVIELGCGTAYVSAWLTRRGARCVGIDNSPAQLETARQCQRSSGLDFPLLLGNAEEVPCPDASFDIAISEYGAGLWCDPRRWVPEAFRLLRPGGSLMFLVNGLIHTLCAPDEVDTPAGEVLLRDSFGMYRMEWSDDNSVEFHLNHGDWIRLLRRTGFTIENLVEIRPPADATTTFPYVTLEWARRWPVEEVWVARKPQ